jgi:hypothetical protein
MLLALRGWRAEIKSGEGRFPPNFEDDEENFHTYVGSRI